MINSISQASPFFTDVRSIFLLFPPSPRLAVHRGKSIRCYREARLERFTKKVAIASGLISIHPIRTGAKSIGGRRLCALSSPPLSRLSIRSSLFTLLSSYIYISISTVPRWWPSSPFSPPPPRVDHYGEAASFTLIEGDRWARRITDVW